MEKLIETRFDAAIELRKRMRLPSADTNAYRLVNSEGDRYGSFCADSRCIMLHISPHKS